MPLTRDTVRFCPVDQCAGMIEQRVELEDVGSGGIAELGDDLAVEARLDFDLTSEIELLGRRL